MANFSKQWCEKNDPDMPWDFDILEVADKLTLEYGSFYICEGFGFALIAKDEKGDIVLGFPDYIEEKVNWKTYNEVING